MTAKRKFTLIWLLLPLLLLRGLVPAGFMIDLSGGSLSIVMCDGAGPLAVAAINQDSGNAIHQDHHEQMDHSQHQGHGSDASGNHHSGHQGAGHEKHKNSICPFAMAGSAATFVGIPSLSAEQQPVRILAAAESVAFQGLHGPSRAQQSRAPPYFS